MLLPSFPSREPELGAAAAATTRGEDDGVGSVEVAGERVDVGLLEVEDEGTGPRGLEVGGVVGVADDADGVVPGVGESAFEELGDLAVSSGDDDSHEPRQHPGSRRPSSCR